MLEAVLARDPKNADALVTRGKLHLTEGNTVNALTTLQTAVEANPRRSTAPPGAGARPTSLRGAAKEATTAYNDALKLDGKSASRRGSASPGCRSTTASRPTRCRWC